MKIAYAPRALRDIDEILAYIQERSPRGAHSVSLAIEYAVQMCALNPRAAGRTNDPEVYRRPVGRYRYTVFYRAGTARDGIEVIRVLHSARIRDLHQVPDE